MAFEEITKPSVSEMKETPNLVEMILIGFEMDSQD